MLHFPWSHGAWFLSKAVFIYLKLVILIISLTITLTNEDVGGTKACFVCCCDCRGLLCCFSIIAFQWISWMAVLQTNTNSDSESVWATMRLCEAEATQQWSYSCPDLQESLPFIYNLTFFFFFFKENAEKCSCPHSYSTCSNFLFVIKFLVYQAPPPFFSLSTRKIKTNYFIVSLAFADLLVSVLVMPFGAIELVHQHWIYGETFCLVRTSLDVLLTTASILHLCCIALDRWGRFPVRLWIWFISSNHNKTN